MSFFRRLVGVAAPIVGGIFGGPLGAAAGAALGGAIQKAPAQQPVFSAFTGSMPSSAFPVGFGSSLTPAMGTLPQIGRGVLPALGFGAGVVVARGRTIARAASALCIKHPQWCSTIGGTAAVITMMESGQLPVPRRRRGRGLTPRDLRSFRRVASLVRGFCPTVRRIPSRAIHARKTGIVHA